MMGEPVKTPETTTTAAEPAKQEKSLAEVLAEPMTEDEARKAVADIEVNLAKLAALRVDALARISQIDYQIEAAKFDRAVVYRRVLNKVDEKKEEAK